MLHRHATDHLHFAVIGKTSAQIWGDDSGVLTRPITLHDPRKSAIQYLQRRWSIESISVSLIFLNQSYAPISLPHEKLHFRMT